MVVLAVGDPNIPSVRIFVETAFVFHWWMIKGYVKGNHGFHLGGHGSKDGVSFGCVEDMKPVPVEDETTHCLVQGSPDELHSDDLIPLKRLRRHISNMCEFAGLVIVFPDMCHGGLMKLFDSYCETFLCTPVKGSGVAIGTAKSDGILTTAYIRTPINVGKTTAFDFLLNVYREVKKCKIDNDEEFRENLPELIHSEPTESGRLLCPKVEINTSSQPSRPQRRTAASSSQPTRLNSARSLSRRPKVLGSVKQNHYRSSTRKRRPEASPIKEHQ